MNVCCLITLHMDMLTLSKRANVNTKGENGKMLLYLACGINHDSMELCQLYAWYSISFFFFFYFINHKLYEFVSFLQLCKYHVRIICTKGKRELM